MRDRFAEIISAHKPRIGYWNTGTTRDDSHHWTPCCECGWKTDDLPTEEQAEAEHTAHVALVLEDYIVDLAGAGRLLATINRIADLTLSPRPTRRMT